MFSRQSPQGVATLNCDQGGIEFSGSFICLLTAIEILSNAELRGTGILGTSRHDKLPPGVKPARVRQITSVRLGLPLVQDEDFSPSVRIPQVTISQLSQAVVSLHSVNDRSCDFGS